MGAAVAAMASHQIPYCTYLRRSVINAYNAYFCLYMPTTNKKNIYCIARHTFTPRHCRNQTPSSQPSQSWSHLNCLMNLITTGCHLDSEGLLQTQETSLISHITWPILSFPSLLATWAALNSHSPFTPWKIQMERPRRLEGDLEDDVPFQFGDFLASVSTFNGRSWSVKLPRLPPWLSWLPPEISGVSMIGWSIKHWQRYIYIYINT